MSGGNPVHRALALGGKRFLIPLLPWDVGFAPLAAELEWEKGDGDVHASDENGDGVVESSE